MDFLNKLEMLAGSLEQKTSHILTEEATKTALVMPFLHNVLGYNIFDPSEVVPEFTSDVAGKKGEKVDFALVQDGSVQILIECKKHQEELSLKHAAQLCRYFHTILSARIGILTNGIKYEFYTDLDAPNIMDEQPFLVLDLLNIDEVLVHEIKKIAKTSFDIGSFVDVAEELKYLRKIKDCLAKQLHDPSDEFLSCIISHVYNGLKTQKIKTQFYEIFKKASSQYLADEINKRLKKVMDNEVGTLKIENNQPTVELKKEAPSVVVTQENIDAYCIIKSIVRPMVDASRVTYRNTQNYCGVLLDNKKTQRICRLYFNGKQRYVSLDESGLEVRHNIETIDDIYKLSDKLIDVTLKFCTLAV